jgi:hypothetical protein
VLFLALKTHWSPESIKALSAREFNYYVNRLLNAQQK